ncbi:MAG: hypothetical protein GY730_03250 [bacterium]|nr:hypothetical protein [bacterium]
MDFIRRASEFKSSSEFIDSIKAEDMFAENIGDQTGKKQDEEAVKAKKKRRLANKPKSVSLLEGSLDSKGLLSGFTDKLAYSSVMKNRDRVKSRIKKGMDRSLEEFFKNESTNKSRDTVSLSANVLTNKEDLDKYKKNNKDNKHSSAIKGSRENAAEGKSGVSNNAALEGAKAEAGHYKMKPGTGRFERNEGTEKLLKQYADVYSELLVREDPKKRTVLENLKQRLFEKGVTSKKQKIIEDNIRNFHHKDMKQYIKKAILNYIFSYADKRKMSIDLLKNKEHFEELSDIASKIGIFNDIPLEEVMNETKRESTFILHEGLDEALVAGKLKGSPQEEIIKSFNRYNTLAGVLRFNADEYFKSFKKKMDDLGLNYFEDPDKKGVVDTDLSSDPDAKGGHGQGGQHFSEDSIEMIEDKLRILLMNHAVSPGNFGDIGNMLKIRKLENLLRKAGYDDKQISNLKEEAKGISRIPLSRMLREGFEKRATLNYLQGPAYDLVKRQIKNALKGFRRLGSPLKKQEILNIRNNINKSIFSIVREEYIKIEVISEANPDNLELAKKKKKYLTILERLKKESDIQEEIKPKLFHNTGFSSDMNIVEAA